MKYVSFVKLSNDNFGNYCFVKGKNLILAGSPVLLYHLLSFPAILFPLSCLASSPCPILGHGLSNRVSEFSDKNQTRDRVSSLTHLSIFGRKVPQNNNQLHIIYVFWWKILTYNNHIYSLQRLHPIPNFDKNKKYDFMYLKCWLYMHTLLSIMLTHF